MLMTAKNRKCKNDKIANKISQAKDIPFCVPYH
jgi:hypothetical protein